MILKGFLPSIARNFGRFWDPLASLLLHESVEILEVLSWVIEPIHPVDPSFPAMLRFKPQIVACDEPGPPVVGLWPWR